MIHQSSVNFRSLIGDLARMYPYEIKETVLVETIANALDAGATEIAIAFDPYANILRVCDDGCGMDEKTFTDYHDFAVSLKPRGSGIGFAGLGAKIAFNFATRVVTETRSPDYTGGSNWYLKGKNLIWEDIRVRRIPDTGTYVEIRFREGADPIYTSRDVIVDIVKKHYTPLFIKQLLQFYSKAGVYSPEPRFIVNDIEIPVASVPQDERLGSFKPVALQDTKGKEVGLGYFALSPQEVSENQKGPALCTYGKVIKRDFLESYPMRYADRITGIIEIPRMASCLTTSKTDFNKTSGDWRRIRKTYEKAQNAFKLWLSELGALPEVRRSRAEAGKLERVVRQIIASLPEVEEFMSGTSRREVLISDRSGTSDSSFFEGIEPTFPNGQGTRKGGEILPGEGPEDGQRLERQAGGEKKASPLSRRSRKGPRVGWVDVPDRKELGWLDQDMIYINQGHAAYKRAEKKYRYYHDLVAVAAVIAKYANRTGVEPIGLFDRFLSTWGRL